MLFIISELLWYYNGVYCNFYPHLLQNSVCRN